MTSPRRKKIKWERWCDRHEDRYLDLRRREFARKLKRLRSRFGPLAKHLSEQNPLTELIKAKGGSSGSWGHVITKPLTFTEWKDGHN